MRRPSFFALASLLGILALTACRRDEIQTYTVKKDSADTAPALAQPPSAPSASVPAASADTASAAQAADAAMRNTAVNTASGPALAWTTPAGWTTGPERPMRKDTLLIAGEAGAPGAELAVTAFPGDVGGNLANVNRWRQQLSLPPISQTELGAALQHLDVGALHIDVIELVGPAAPPAAPQRVLGAIVPYAGATWFFKLTGPDALIAREKENFLALVRSLRPAS
jgi:hypothetical protein